MKAKMYLNGKKKIIERNEMKIIGCVFVKCKVLSVFLGYGKNGCES
jgi:hypothetical protein